MTSQLTQPAQMPTCLDDVYMATIRIGYVGLPLAMEFGKTRPTIAFDNNAERVEALSQGNYETLKGSMRELNEAEHLQFTNDPDDLSEANVFIVIVPTPSLLSQPLLSQRQLMHGNVPT